MHTDHLVLKKSSREKMCLMTYSGLRGLDTLSGETTLSKLFTSLLKRGLIYSPDPFSEGVGVQENKQGVTKFVSLIKHGNKKNTKCINIPKEI